MECREVTFKPDVIVEYNKADGEWLVLCLICKRASVVNVNVGKEISEAAVTVLVRKHAYCGE